MDIRIALNHIPDEPDVDLGDKLHSSIGRRGPSDRPVRAASVRLIGISSYRVHLVVQRAEGKLLWVGMI